MFKIFLDLEFPFKVDTCTCPITDIAKRYLRAKRATNWSSFSVDLQFSSKVDKRQMFENSMDLHVHLIRISMVCINYQSPLPSESEQHQFASDT